MKHLISTKQMMYSVTSFIIASSLLTKALYKYTKNQTWVSVIIALAISLIIISIYGRLAKKYPGAGLLGINDAVFGTVIGKIVSALYIFFFLTLTFFNTQDLGNFVKGFILPSTPMSIIYIIFLLVCAYALRKGAIPMTRYAAVMTYAYIAIIVVNGFLLLNITHFDNLLPVFTLPLKSYMLGASIVTMLPCCEILVFMMFVKYMQSPAEIGKALKKGLVIGACILLFIIIRDITVLGNFANIASMPTYSSIRLINVGDILTRVDIIYAVTIIFMLFFKVSILLFASVSGVSELFGIKNYKNFIFIIGALAVIYSGAIFPSSAEHLKWFDAAATYSTFFVFVLPAVTLIVSEFKKSGNKEKSDTSAQEQ